MFNLIGKYNDCIVYTDNCDNSTISQIYTILNQPTAAGSSIRIMPDCHAGKARVIGTTMTIVDIVMPNLVGADIGCGMSAVKIEPKKGIHLEKLDKFITQNIPHGAAINKTAIATFDYALHHSVNEELMDRYIGSLGGGNHFIELDRDSNGDYWLVVHSGSRNLGVAVNKFCQDLAYEDLKAINNGGTLQELTKGKNKKEIAKIKAEYNRPFETPMNLRIL